MNSCCVCEYDSNNEEIINDIDEIVMILRKKNCMDISEKFISDIRKIYLNINIFNGDDIYELLYNFNNFIKYIYNIKDDIRFIILERNENKYYYWDNYHIVCCNYCMSMVGMIDMIELFRDIYKEYSECIDMNIYRERSYFRCINSSTKVLIDGDMKDVYYKIYKYVIDGNVVDINKEDDELIKESIVGYIDNCELLGNIKIDKIDIVDIRSFKEKKIKKEDNLLNILCEMRDREVDNSYSRYEYLGWKMRRIYLDIEGYCKDLYGIDEIMNSFCEFMEKRLNGREKPILNYTINKHSGHSQIKLNSYHVVCSNYSMYPSGMYSLVKEFVDENECYKDVIDLGIYDENRLFKLPYYKGLPRKGDIRDSDYDNYHMVKGIEMYDDDDKINILSNYIIQYTCSTELLLCEDLNIVNRFENNYSGYFLDVIKEDIKCILDNYIKDKEDLKGYLINIVNNI